MAETDRDRIKVLEAGQKSLEEAVADLLARMDRLDPPKKITPVLQDEGARTFFPRICPMEMPTPAQFQKLFAIVERAYPNNIPDFSGEWEREEFIRRVGLAFEHLTSMRRSGKMNDRYYLDGWTDRANEWLRQQGSPAIETSHFFVAVLMSGDIPFRLANRAAGIVLAFGLTSDSDAVTASSSGWKSVLENSRPRSPIETVVQREHNTLVRVAR